MNIITDIILPIALAFIMFSLGLGLKVNDFSRIIFKPKEFFIGFFSQIIILPLVAIILVLIWPLPPEIAIGVMIIACAPGGATSNILTSLLAKKQGCTKAISLANDTTYRSILEPLGIDDVLSPQAITVSRILSYIRKGSIRQVYSLREGEGEVIEADAVEASSVVNKKISELKLPNGVKIGAVLKNENDVHIPNPNLQINEGDRVILFSLSKMIKKVENLLSVRFRFY